MLYLLPASLRGQITVLPILKEWVFLLLHLRCPTTLPGKCFNTKKSPWLLLWCHFSNALWYKLSSSLNWSIQYSFRYVILMCVKYGLLWKAGDCKEPVSSRSHDSWAQTKVLALVSKQNVKQTILIAMMCILKYFPCHIIYWIYILIIFFLCYVHSVCLSNCCFFDFQNSLMCSIKLC